MENIETADFADAINRELYSRSVQIRNYLHHAEGTKHWEEYCTCTEEVQKSDRIVVVTTPFRSRPKMPKVTFFKKSLWNARANSAFNHFYH